MKSRREFLKTSAVFMGVLGAAGLSGNLSKEVLAVDIGPDPSKMLMLNRENLGKLGNNLAASASERQKFLSNPQGYSESFLGGKLDAASKTKLQMLQEMIAGGFCCHGCGCGVPAQDVKIRTY